MKRTLILSTALSLISVAGFVQAQSVNPTAVSPVKPSVVTNVVLDAVDLLAANTTVDPIDPADPMVTQGTGTVLIVDQDEIDMDVDGTDDAHEKAEKAEKADVSESEEGEHAGGDHDGDHDNGDNDGGDHGDGDNGGDN